MGYSLGFSLWVCHQTSRPCSSTWVDPTMEYSQGYRQSWAHTSQHSWIHVIHSNYQTHCGLKYETNLRLHQGLCRCASVSMSSGPQLNAAKFVQQFCTFAWKPQLDNHYIVYFITEDLDPRAQCQGQSQSELFDHLEATSLTRGEGTVICTRVKILCTIVHLGTLCLDFPWSSYLYWRLGAWFLEL